MTIQVIADQSQLSKGATSAGVKQRVEAKQMPSQEG